MIEPEETSFKNSNSASGPYIEAESISNKSELKPPPPPVAVNNSYDPLAAQRETAMQQEARRMAREQQKRQQERLKSTQLIFDQSSDTMNENIKNTSRSGGASLLSGGGHDDDNLAFADRYGNQGVETVQAVQLENLDTLIPQGTLIAGILETAIQSDLPGMVRAIVSDNVYSFDGSQLLITKGSKLVGQYKSGVVRGQTRVFVIWNRLIRSDGVSVNIGSFGTDSLGRSGLGGYVDTHFFERFGSSVLLSLIDAGIQIGADSIDNDNSSTVALDTGEDFSRSAEIALENSIAIPPTIHVNQGSSIKVFVGKDLDFSTVSGR